MAEGIKRINVQKKPKRSRMAPLKRSNSPMLTIQEYSAPKKTEPIRIVPKVGNPSELLEDNSALVY